MMAFIAMAKATGRCFASKGKHRSWFGTKNLLRNSRKDSRNYGPNPCGNFERSISTLEFQRNAALCWFRASDGLTGARSSGDELWRERLGSSPPPPPWQESGDPPREREAPHAKSAAAITLFFQPPPFLLQRR